MMRSVRREGLRGLDTTSARIVVGMSMAPDSSALTPASEAVRLKALAVVAAHSLATAVAPVENAERDVIGRPSSRSKSADLASARKADSMSTPLLAAALALTVASRSVYWTVLALSAETSALVYVSVSTRFTRASISAPRASRRSRDVGIGVSSGSEGAERRGLPDGHPYGSPRVGRRRSAVKVVAASAAASLRRRPRRP